MAWQSVAPEDERARKTEAIRLFSFGFLVTAMVAEAAFIIMWLFTPDLPIMVLTGLAAATIITSLLTYWANRSGYTGFAGYFLVIGLIVVFTAAIYLIGGSAGPIAIILALPILVASIVIGIKSTFLVATVASVLLLASLWGEANQLFLQIISGEWEEIAQNSSKELSLLYIGTSVRIIVFYVVAFLSWFGASRLQLALQDTQRSVSYTHLTLPTN